MQAEGVRTRFAECGERELSEGTFGYLGLTPDARCCQDVLIHELQHTPESF
jgi:hypothetical protein